MSSDSPSRCRPSEALLIERANGEKSANILTTSLGRAQLAQHLASSNPLGSVGCNYLDLYQADQARQASASLANLHITCEPELPLGEYNLAALPFSMQGDAELTRDLLQQAHIRLAIGGRLLAATDNPADTWLHEQMQKLFDKVTREEQATGVVYSAIKTGPLKKLKNFDCDFAFRDGERLIQVTSRPGVFSHRRVDAGARALMEVMEIQAGERVLEIGCGSGTVSLAAALREPTINVHALDSNPRAIQCTLLNAQRNNVENLTATLNANVEVSEPESYDAVLANPPYYSHHKIAELFMLGAHRALRRGGRLYLVTKHTTWYEQHLPRWFRHIEVMETRGYFVMTARRG